MSAKIVVVAGPSGSGKNTLIDRLLERIPGSTRLVTATTRLPRPHEEDGVDYYFYSMEKFDAELAAGNIAGQRFVPLFGGVHYGIYLPELRTKMASASIVFVPVDRAGAEYLKENFGALTIFIMPESFSEYRTRIRSRSPEMTEREFDMRMQIAEREVKIDAETFDHRVLNAGGLLSATVEDVMEILQKEGYIR